MEKISLWIKLCSVCAVVSAVFMVAVPESKLKNAYKTLCATVMLFAFFSVFTSAENIDYSKFDFSQEKGEEIAPKNEELLTQEGEKMMNRFIENKLYEGKIEAVCKTQMQYINDTLKVQCIYLYGSFSEEEKVRANEIIHKSLKEECEVIFAKSNE